MKIAVTGARGFVGRHTIRELARRDVELIAVERPGSSLHDRDPVAVSWLALDIAKPPENCFEALGKPDVLLHLAWDGLPNYRSLHHFETELPRQFSFLANNVRHGLPALVAVGTCFEYGNLSGPLPPHLETNPTNPYGFAKDALRKQLQYLQATSVYKLAWPRLFYMYGEDQAETSLFPMLKAAALAGETDFPMSGGEQLRDYLPIVEVAKRLADLATNPINAGPLNICSGTPISVRRLVENWVKENGWTITPQFGKLPYPNYEPMAFWGSR